MLSSQEEGCIDPDVDFESSWFALQLMVEAMLSGDGYFECFRNSSSTFMGPFYAYLFIMVTAIMLVNMLVALMAKTFDEITERVNKHFLYGKTRKQLNWVNYPPVPPPFNFLSLGYYSAQLVLTLMFMIAKVARGRMIRRQQIPAAAADKSEVPPPRRSSFGMPGLVQQASNSLDLVKQASNSLNLVQQVSNNLALRPVSKPLEASLPQSWLDGLGDEPIERLVAQIVEFKRENATAETQQEDFKIDVFAILAELRQDIKELKAMQEWSPSSRGSRQERAGWIWDGEERLSGKEATVVMPARPHRGLSSLRRSSCCRSSPSRGHDNRQPRSPFLRPPRPRAPPATEQSKFAVLAKGSSFESEAHSWAHLTADMREFLTAAKPSPPATSSSSIRRPSAVKLAHHPTPARSRSCL